jgi:hypothetical protein
MVENLCTMLLFFYYEILLGRFMHKRWIDVQGGCVTQKLIIFSQPLFVRLDATNQFCSGKPIYKVRLALYVQILLENVGCQIITHGHSTNTPKALRTNVVRTLMEDACQVQISFISLIGKVFFHTYYYMH